MNGENKTRIWILLEKCDNPNRWLFLAAFARDEDAKRWVKENQYATGDVIWEYRTDFAGGPAWHTHFETRPLHTAYTVEYLLMHCLIH